MCTTFKIKNNMWEFTREFYTVNDKSEMIIDTLKKGAAILSIIELTEDELHKVAVFANDNFDYIENTISLHGRAKNE